MSTDIANSIDVRTIAPAPRERHTVIFSRFEGLQQGESLLLINDHDPRPLYYPFQVRHTGQFDWTCLQANPSLWQVEIGKTATAKPDASAGSCCSGRVCGG